MRFSSSLIALFLGLSASIVSASLPIICRHLKTKNHGCERYVEGSDITGVLTTLDLGLMDSVCDCIKACLDRPLTCASYVYKFTSAEGVIKNKRDCTLYSDFNLPSGVEVVFDLNDPRNVNITTVTSNPDTGGLVPEAFKDENLNTTSDEDAVSG
jgi:urease beta subunit